MTWNLQNIFFIYSWKIKRVSAHSFWKNHALKSIQFHLLTWFSLFICTIRRFVSKSNDNSFQIEGYNLVEADHRNDAKRGGGCIYYCESRPSRVIKIPYLKESVLLELPQKQQKIFVSVVYRSLSETNNGCNIFSELWENSSRYISTETIFHLSYVGFCYDVFLMASNDVNTTERIKLLWLTSCNANYKWTNSSIKAKLLLHWFPLISPLLINDKFINISIFV